VLKQSAGSIGPWYRRYGLSVVALTLGVIALLVAFYLQFGRGKAITDVPDLRVTLPLLVVTVAAGVAALLRHERLWALPVAGMACAVGGVVVGWLVLVGAVAAATILVIVIIAKLT
jgi:hypothetical protein